MNTKDFQEKVIVLLIGILIMIILCFALTAYQVIDSESKIRREIICQQTNNSLPECENK